MDFSPWGSPRSDATPPRDPERLPSAPVAPPTCSAFGSQMFSDEQDCYRQVRAGVVPNADRWGNAHSWCDTFYRDHCRKWHDDSFVPPTARALQTLEGDIATDQHPSAPPPIPSLSPNPLGPSTPSEPLLSLSKPLVPLRPPTSQQQQSSLIDLRKTPFVPPAPALLNPFDAPSISLRIFTIVGIATGLGILVWLVFKK
jgi:hypothetical protein